MSFQRRTATIGLVVIAVVNSPKVSGAPNQAGVGAEKSMIRAATEKLRIAARDEKAPAHEQLAEALAAHAQTEEEVLYPAAILVGDIIRARSAKK